MMPILHEIIARKQQELVLRKQHTPVRSLEAAVYFKADTCSLRDRLAGGKGLVAEFKRRAPSSGVLHADASVTQVVGGYAKAGAAGISVLTDKPFFGALPDDLQQAAAAKKSVPLLRKDFILDEYQILEAKAMGADVVLLIASILSGSEIKSFSRLAHSLGLEVLLEIHQQAELEKYTDTIDLIGVNNRNLETFETDLDHGIRLLGQLPKELPAVSESGIRDVDDAIKMLDAGYQALLIGTQFMQLPEPEKSFAAFSGALKQHHSASFCKSEPL